MTPRQHIASQKAKISRASLGQLGCSPATAEAILIAAGHPESAVEVLNMNLEYARTTVDQAALLGALAVFRNRGTLEVAA